MFRWKYITRWDSLAEVIASLQGRGILWYYVNLARCFPRLCKQNSKNGSSHDHDVIGWEESFIHNDSNKITQSLYKKRNKNEYRSQ